MRNHRNFWDRNAGRYDRFMRKDRAAYEEMYALIRPVVKAKTVLELATGTGLIAKHIVNAAAHIEATDASAEMILEAKREWERGDHMTPLKKALEHEKLVTASIDAIYAAAYEVRDFRAMQMLDWFIKEQGEEEKNAADLITKMELFGGDSKGLYMLNSELKARVYTAPSLVL